MSFMTTIRRRLLAAGRLALAPAAARAFRLEPAATEVAAEYAAAACEAPATH
jgi:hypothetical protein